MEKEGYTIVKLKYKVPNDKFEKFAEYLANIKALLESRPKGKKLISSSYHRPIK